jgi:hypothetical protein
LAKGVFRSEPERGRTDLKGGFEEEGQKTGRKEYVIERHVIVDPYLLALPEPGGDFASYIAGLVEWLPALKEQRDNCSCFRSSLQPLMTEGRFPTLESLKRALVRAEVTEVTAVDLMQLFVPIGATEPFFEYFVGTHDIDASNVNVTPELVIDRLGANLGSVVKNSLMLVAVAHDQGWCLTSTYWATSNVDDDWLVATGDAGLVASATGDVVAIDRPLIARLKILTRSSALKIEPALVSVYKDPLRATTIVIERLRQFDPSIPPVVSISAGEGFVASLEAYGVVRQPSLLEAVYTRAALAALNRLQNLKGAKLHPKRTGPAADAPQVTREDGARLWRCMVTQKGAGLRLHFWTRPDGQVELDRILKESEA